MNINVVSNITSAIFSLFVGYTILMRNSPLPCLVVLYSQIFVVGKTNKSTFLILFSIPKIVILATPVYNNSCKKRW